MRITQAFLLVDDHDAAQRFYTEVLGLEVEADHQGEGFRWLGPKASGPDGGASLVLRGAANAALASQQEQCESGMPAFSFCIADDAELEGPGRAGPGWAWSPPASRTAARMP